MALPGLVPFTSATTTSASEDLSKKIRKPYTITKSRESWTEPEHDKFLEALQLFDRDWRKIEAFIGSKTVIQIRSHAQKYFLKVQKSGTGEHLPPPRPKRKASHPYPQKASKTDPFVTRPLGSYSVEPVIAMKPEASLQPTDHPQSQFSAPRTTDNCCSSAESNPPAKINLEHFEIGDNQQTLRVLPDFAIVYSFIGNVCDPNSTGHLQSLKEMDPIDVETVLLLMRNFSINLASPDFEDQRKLLLSYENEDGRDKCDDG